MESRDVCTGCTGEDVRLRLEQELHSAELQVSTNSNSRNVEIKMFLFITPLIKQLFRETKMV